MTKGLLITLGVVVALVVGAFSMYGYVNSMRNDGIRMETALSAQYLDNQNELSSFKSSFYEQMGVANLKSDKLDQIISDAVKGRYEGKMEPGTGGAMFSAITEAYPDLKGQLDLYDRIVDFVRAGREAYKSKQTKLIDMLRVYDYWRQEGLVKSMFLGNFFPSQALNARIGASVQRGQAALDQMYIIVLTSDTKKAYETGTDEPMQVPGGKK
ncbi:MAG: hypothetical protein SGJ27_24695 [Candidatus Melainabacteria bacterium]|nr:hypothetical protein [Candidatus Melainabacteria bacterium]